MVFVVVRTLIVVVALDDGNSSLIRCSCSSRRNDNSSSCCCCCGCRSSSSSGMSSRGIVIVVMLIQVVVVLATCGIHRLSGIKDNNRNSSVRNPCLDGFNAAVATAAVVAPFIAGGSRRRRHGDNGNTRDCGRSRLLSPSKDPSSWQQMVVVATARLAAAAAVAAAVAILTVPWPLSSQSHRPVRCTMAFPRKKTFYACKNGWTEYHCQAGIEAIT